MDSPVGTGFSYSTTLEGYYVDDEDAVSQSVEFLRKVCGMSPKKNPTGPRIPFEVQNWLW